MNLRIVQLVWRRELQDQLRDRRTLFMVAVLPLLIYPLMGGSFFQLAQFMRAHTARVLVVGAEQLRDNSDLPALIDEGRFDASLFEGRSQESREAERRRIKVSLADGATVPNDAREQLAAGKLDAVVVLPEGFSQRLGELRTRLQALGDGGASPARGDVRVPRPTVLYNSVREASQVAHLRVERLLDRWQERIVNKNLADSGAPAGLAKPFRVEQQDVARGRGRLVGLWSVLLPFVVFIWALTGAFYPAIDLCAGEKERGTLETLLASPARRVEIVWGKLLTVMVFSMVTALLNLVGMALTSQFIAGQLGALSGAPGLSAPPISSLLWLVIALPPVAALFSALSLACAAFARSTKEGQYYFMPLFLALLPLMLMPMAPGVDLTLGNALVPVMGLVLMLQALLEGRLAEAAPYFVPVTLVTLGCCLLAVKWAVSQFNQESVLFSESERFDLRLWLRRAIRNRAETPTAALAVAGMAMVFLLQFFATAVLSRLGLRPGLPAVAVSVLVSQACVLLPALGLGLWLTRNPRRTFLLDGAPRWEAVLGAVGLAVALHPAGLQMASWISRLYPLDEGVLSQAKAFGDALNSAPSPLIPLLLAAVLPAICEELTFRGFLLSGLRKVAGTGWAIVLSAVAFGAVHTLLQQSIGAAILGVLLGYLAVRTGSLLPGIAFHAFYNSLNLLSSYYADGLSELEGWAAVLRPQAEGGELAYHPVVTLAGLAVGAVLLWRIAAASPGTPGNPPGRETAPRRPLGEPLLTGGDPAD